MRLVNRGRHREGRRVALVVTLVLLGLGSIAPTASGATSPTSLAERYADGVAAYERVSN